MDTLQIYLKELKNRHSTQEETIKLIIKSRNGDQKAKDELIENYLLFVYKEARKFINMGVPLGDIVQEGSMGLLIAADKYDIENGAPFGSYSRYWIRQSIIRNCMHKKRIVRLPENISELLRTDRWKGQDYREISIDLPYEDGGSFSDTLADDVVDNTFVSEEEAIMKQKVENILSTLKKRDADVVREMYGIGVVKPEETDDQAKQRVAKMFNISTTRVSQIVKSSLNTMRESQVSTNRKSDIRIISAAYGSEEVSIDVTSLVTVMLENNELVKSSNKLAGDPCKGTPKHLFVKYTMDGKSISKKFSEGSYLKF